MKLSIAGQVKLCIILDHFFGGENPVFFNKLNPLGFEFMGLNLGFEGPTWWVLGFLCVLSH